MIVVREIREDAEGVGNETSLVKVTKVEFPTICLACLFCTDIGLNILLEDLRIIVRVIAVLM